MEVSHMTGIKKLFPALAAALTAALLPCPALTALGSEAIEAECSAEPASEAAQDTCRTA